MACARASSRGLSAALRPWWYPLLHDHLRTHPLPVERTPEGPSHQDDHRPGVARARESAVHPCSDGTITYCRMVTSRARFTTVWGPATPTRRIWDWVSRRSLSGTAHWAEDLWKLLGRKQGRPDHSPSEPPRLERRKRAGGSLPGHQRPHDVARHRRQRDAQHRVTRRNPQIAKPGDAP
jgi:hypothetical protein